MISDNNMEGVNKYNDERRYILISDLASETPYSQAYLSLLARRGRIDAKKIGRNWHVSPEGLQEYLVKQGIPVFIPKAFPSKSKLRRPLDPSLVFASIPPNEEEPSPIPRPAPIPQSPPAPATPPVPPATPDVSPPLDELGAPQHRVLEDVPLAEIKREERVEREEKGELGPVEEFKVSPEKFFQKKLEQQRKFLEVEADKRARLPDGQGLEPTVEAEQTRITPPIQTPPVAKREESDKGVEGGVEGEKKGPAEATDLEKTLEKFVDVLDKRLSQPRTRVGRTAAALNQLSAATMGRPSRWLMVFLVTIVVIGFVFGGFGFGSASALIYKAREIIKDATTLQGHTPGTHANEVLLLDKEGKISIYGHIETKGQLRSYVEEGIAPIVVDSTTTVENLSADYLDNVSAEEFTLAFVTKNGSVTTEKVFLEGGVEVGETLLVKSANKLAQAIIEGNLSTLGSISIGKDLVVNGFSTLAGGADIFTRLLVRGDAEITNLVVAQRGQIKEGGLMVSGHTQLNTLGVSGGASINNLGVAAKLSVGGDIDLGNSTADKLVVNASSTFKGTVNLAEDIFVMGSVRFGDADNDNAEFWGTSLGFNSSATNTIGVTTGLNIDENTLVLDARANRVGLGTSSPGTLLAVQGTGNIQNDLTVGGILKANNVVTASTTLASGFGTTSPYALLSVEIATSTKLPAFVVHDQGTSSPSFAVFPNNFVGLSTSSPGLLFSVQGAANVGSLTVEGPLKISSFVSTSSDDSFIRGALGIGTSSPGAALGVKGAGIFEGFLSADYFTSTSSNNSWLLGQLGIGTTTPGTRLDVAGSGLIKGNFTAEATSSVSSLIATSTLEVRGASGSDLIVQDGRVGVGTSTAGQLLSVAGTGLFQNNLTAESAFEVQGTATFNAQVWSGDITASTGGVDIASAGTRLGVLYADEVNATTLVGTISGGNVSAQTMTINSDNATADTENSNLAFERGSITPNALITWHAGNDQLETNAGLFIYREIDSADNAGYALDAVGAGRFTTDLDILGGDINLGTGSATSTLTSASALLGIGSTTPWGVLSVEHIASGDENLPAFVVADQGTTTPSFIVMNASGRVGVATSSPQAALAVGGNSLISGDLTIGGALKVSSFIATTTLQVGAGSTSSPAYSFTTDTDTGITSGGADNMLSFITGGSVRSVIDKSGNVGIGTANPNIGGSGLTNAVLTVQGSSSYGVLELARGGTLLEVQSIGYIIFTGPNETNKELASISAVTPSGGTAGNRGADLAFWTKADNGSTFQRMRILSTGNVGIGTTDPSMLLHINEAAGGSNSNRIRISDGDVAHGMTSIIPTDVFAQIQPVSTTAGGIELIGVSDTDTSAFILTAMSGGTGTLTGPVASFDLYKKTGTTRTAITGSDVGFQIRAGASTALMTVLGGGSVGIGTTTPGTRLDVAGDGLVKGGLYVQATGTVSSLIATSTLEVRGAGGSDLMVVDGRVGINTTLPDELLEVARGATDGYNLKLSTSGSTDTGLLLARDGVGGSHIISISGGQGMGFYTSNSAVPTFSATSQMMLLNTGNIGIGTTTPAKVLQIASTGAAQLMLTDTSAAADLKHWYASSSAGSLSFGSANDRLTSFTERVRIDSSGNVGIGTAGPGALLHISETNEADHTRVFVEHASDANKASIIQLNRARGTVASKSIPSADDILGVLSMRGWDGSDWRNHAEIVAYGEGSPFGGRLVFSTNAPGGTGASERMRIDSSGNVGIGTTTPGALLSVQGASNVGSLTVEGVLKAGTLMATSSIQNAAGSTSSPAYSFTTDTDTGLTSGGADNMLSFITGGSVRQVIDKLGNVGIGTAGPSTKLHVSTAAQTTLTVEGTGTDSNPVVGLKNDVQEWHLQTRGVDGDAFVIRDNTGSAGNALVITTSGNVGIGTKDPSQALEVSTTGRFGTTLDVGTDLQIYGGDINLGTGSATSTLTSSGGLLGLASTTPWGLFSVEATTDVNSRNPIFVVGDAGTTTPFLYVSGNSGNVGIGTANPGAKLDVRTTSGVEALHVYDRNGVKVFTVPTDLAGGTAGYFNGNVGIGTINPSQALEVATTGRFGTTLDIGTDLQVYGGDINLGTGSATSTLTSSSGNLGIGTTSPAYLLDVSGASGGVIRIVTTGQAYFRADAATISNDAGTIYMAKGTNRWAIGLLGASVAADGNFYIYDNVADIPRLTIDDANGNVGIGTTSPGNLLAVDGDGTVSGNFYALGTTTTSSLIATSTLEVRGASGSDLMVVDGRVGIGTAAPAEKLELSGGRLRLPQTNEATTPTLNFGDGDTGFFEIIDDQLGISIAGAQKWVIASTVLGSSDAGGARMLQTGTSATVPYIFESGDSNTGMGAPGADLLSLITGGNEAMRITNTGLVGIASSTPRGRLGIEGASTTPALLIRAGNTTGDGAIAISVASGDLCDDNGTPAGCALNDIAELFLAEEGIQPGDVVAFGSNLKLTKASTTNALAGVISTAPAIVIEGNRTLALSGFYSRGSGKAPLALSGRVPVKIASTSPAISVGDFLTVSADAPGWAAKATEAGYTIGKALEAYDPANPPVGGKISMFVNLTYYAGETQTLAGTNANDAKPNASAQGGSASGGNDANSEQISPISPIGQIGQILTNLWKITKSALTSITNTLYTAANSVLASSTQLVVGAEDADTITYETYNLQSTREELIASGSATLVMMPESANAVVHARIRFDQSFTSLIDPNEQIKVIVTPTTKLNGGLYVHEKSPYGFEVREINAQDEGGMFDWLVIAKTKGNAEQTQNNAEQTQNNTEQTQNNADLTQTSADLTQTDTTADTTTATTTTTTESAPTETATTTEPISNELSSEVTASTTPTTEPAPETVVEPAPVEETTTTEPAPEPEPAPQPTADQPQAGTATTTP